MSISRRTGGLSLVALLVVVPGARAQSSGPGPAAEPAAVAWAGLDRPWQQAPIEAPAGQEPAQPSRPPQAPFPPQPPPGTPQAPQPPQTPHAPGPPPQAARAPGPPPQAIRRGQPVNIRVDLTITDVRGSEPPVSKQVSATVADQENGLIRSDIEVPIRTDGGGSGTTGASLNVDVRPELVGDNRVRLSVSLQYDAPDANVAPDRRLRTHVRESATIILDSGKPLVMSQSADPVNDRQVSVEVKATILK